MSTATQWTVRLAGALALLSSPARPLRADCPPLVLDKGAEAVATRAWARLVKKAGAQPDYGAMVRQWVEDPDVRAAFESPMVVDKIADECVDARGVNAGMARDQARLARSLSAAATNPRSVGRLERSGIIDFVGLALSGTNFVSADDTAITLNLNAAGLLRRGDGRRHTPTYEYQHRGLLNRLGGSVTFGSKIPEKDIVGFSGLPDAGKLFDALSWDVKVRVWGDRDPRALGWRRLVLGRLGALMPRASTLAGDPQIPVEAAQAMQSVLRDEIVPQATRDVLREIESSPQVSLKFSGQHLTQERGLNKYAAALLADKGLGNVDATLNVTYSSLDNLATGAGRAFSLRDWRLGLGLSTTVLKDALVSGRGSELTVSGEAAVPRDTRGVPFRRKTVYRADVLMTFPLGETLQIPISVTFTNDLNSPQKKRFVVGRVGIHYDFGSLKRL